MRLLSAILLVASLSSCGPYQVNVDGEVTHKFEIDMENLEKYFRALCEYEQAQDTEACMNLKLAQFLEFMVDSSK